ncbi:acetyl/propionyl/methylcrotonyl-CoA carboxylase subunit alpha [Chitinasiproducens palmae]|uniref:3-methylcrotonoyl-CoA carboxylase, alpha subunit n=1 Tax=Chitinasiproducens palmae TaxID=1770053 RepID=A0A1H2PPQ1_9BURK|nr:acetyl/propionyl/methylcrotonyl-CoA carboxylase subunit alpha [Chitinasiproducens palmae]SDV48285.1 3-methylcrotonoyl-CoA carboxylase, alpha subunit [Chitinasiproducens palmae]
MFSKLLIANRGEIACRVATTCRRLGIATVAVFSEADRHAKHVALADEAVLIGPAPVSDSYLQYERIIGAARRTGAQAIHPGYGFLSENEAFARACAEAGLVFVGPPVAAIAAMGSKAAAKALMQEAAVPLVPGYHGADQEPARLRREADAIGYPVLLKASAGGGGKGMRVVERGDDFATALASCQREARASFGDDRILIEKYLLRPRHVEVQVFADRHGHALYLFDRDCSVQRRHQKVIEEAPAPGLSEATRRAMGEAAVAAARAVAYEGAGTVEFIVSPDGAFYFMEMNTRLQVEHPVTELVTGLDLVEWQLRVAAGEPLPLTEQAALRTDGHAIEARIYAEDPSRGFLPSTGAITHLQVPAASEFAQPDAAGVRIDSGVRAGDSITPYYDPMIAKLIVHGATRAQACDRLVQALDRFEIVGPRTNVAFLRRLVDSEAFRTARLDTGLIERNQATLLAQAGVPALTALALALAAALASEQGEAPGDSPWTRLAFWRVNADARRVWHFRLSEDGADPAPIEVIWQRDTRTGEGAIEYEGRRHAFAVVSDGKTRHDDGSSGTVTVELDGHRFSGSVFHEPARALFHVFADGGHWALELPEHKPAATEDELAGGRLTAPMPGKVVALLVEVGQAVEKGTPLLVLEAMKMEHTILAPAAGVVSELRYAVGDQVDDGAALLVVDASA